MIGASGPEWTPASRELEKAANGLIAPVIEAFLEPLVPPPDVMAPRTITFLDAEINTGVAVPTGRVDVAVTRTCIVDVGRTEGVAVPRRTGVGVRRIAGVDVALRSGIAVARRPGIDVALRSGIAVGRITGVTVTRLAGVVVGRRTGVGVLTPAGRVSGTRGEATAVIAGTAIRVGCSVVSAVAVG